MYGGAQWSRRREDRLNGERVQRKRSGVDGGVMQDLPRESRLTLDAVYLSQPAIDRPSWLARALGVQRYWASALESCGVGTCCQLLAADDEVCGCLVPVFTLDTATGDRALRRVKCEAPQARWVLQSRIWSASADAAEPWGEARLVDLSQEGRERWTRMGGGDLRAWQAWVDEVLRATRSVCGDASSGCRAGTRGDDLREPEQRLGAWCREGGEVLRTHGLTADPVWAGLVRQTTLGLADGEVNHSGRLDSAPRRSRRRDVVFPASHPVSL